MWILAILVAVVFSVVWLIHIGLTIKAQKKQFEKEVEEIRHAAVGETQSLRNLNKAIERFGFVISGKDVLYDV